MRSYADPTADEAMKKVLKRQRGLRSRQNGTLFESMIDASLNWYATKGEAHIEKTPEPMRPLSKPNQRGQFLACYTKQAQPDYKGTLKGGRSIVFEAKHSEGDKIDYGRVTEEQRDALEAHYQLGAVAGVLVSLGMTDFYMVPWKTWRRMMEIYGRKHMKKADLECYKVPFYGGVIKLLDGIEKPADSFEKLCPCFRISRYGDELRHECWGIKEIGPCDCNGDESKCDYYPEKRGERK